jgi:hypothetical protein
MGTHAACRGTLLWVPGIGWLYAIKAATGGRPDNDIAVSVVWHEHTETGVAGLFLSYVHNPTVRVWRSAGLHACYLVE